VTLVGTGRSGWIDGVHYLAVYLEFTGVFTPEGGGEPEFERQQKFYGNGGNLVHPEAIRCDVHFEETIPAEGTFEVTATSSPSLSTDLLDREAALRGGFLRASLAPTLVAK
jgi:hypothetical protein